MRTLPAVAVLLLAAIAHFAAVGLPAGRSEGDAARRLAERVADAEVLQATLAPLSHHDLASVRAEADGLAGQARQRLAILTDASLAPAPLDLTAALRRSVLDGLDPLHASITDQGARDPRAAAALAALLTQLNDNRITQIRTLELEAGGAVQPVPEVAGLVRIGASLVVVADAHDALGLLESLAPGSGEPVIAIRQAALTPVEPSRWASDPARGLGPPVRLSATVWVHFADALGGAAGRPR